MPLRRNLHKDDSAVASRYAESYDWLQPSGRCTGDQSHSVDCNLRVHRLDVYGHELIYCGCKAHTEGRADFGQSIETKRLRLLLFEGENDIVCVFQIDKVFVSRCLNIGVLKNFQRFTLWAHAHSTSENSSCQIISETAYRRCIFLAVSRFETGYQKCEACVLPLLHQRTLDSMRECAHERQSTSRITRDTHITVNTNEPLEEKENEG
ncbi:hypothetical protein CLF_112288 [Clonorchis sinensis]|uniref:Uncharacterized protein n=1 Tax=Clonorchis sinensis TaxID=79923 RepID=G7YW47_CLOSI|nr:hypothetical protein CLF_112288 [Clonorchis sinensis]